MKKDNKITFNIRNKTDTGTYKALSMSISETESINESPACIMLLYCNTDYWHRFRIYM